MSEPVEEEKEGIFHQYNPFRSRNPCMQCKMTGTAAFSILSAWAFIERYKVVKRQPTSVIQKRFFTACGFGIISQKQTTDQPQVS
jgi:hypothetical protein